MRCRRGARWARAGVVSASLFAVVLMLSGCAYMKNRGEDALDIMDFGLTVNKDLMPSLDAYIDYFVITPVGFSYFDGKFIGLYHNQFGVFNYRENMWALGVWGSERRPSEPMDRLDPAHVDWQKEEYAQRPAYDCGIVGAIAGRSHPLATDWAGCTKTFHFGWIGFHHRGHMNELFDFICGWTTLDLMGDDGNRPWEAQEAVQPAPEAQPAEAQPADSAAPAVSGETSSTPAGTKPEGASPATPGKGESQ